MLRRLIDNIRHNLRKPLTAEQKALRASDQLFSEVMVVALLGALLLSTGIFYMLYTTQRFSSDFFVFYNVAQRPWMRTEIYRFGEALIYLRGQADIYAPYIYAPHFLIPLRFMRGMEPHWAEAVWLGLHLFIFAGILLSTPVRLLAASLSQGGQPFAPGSPDRMVQLLFVLALPGLLYCNFAGHPGASACAFLLLGIALLEARPVLAGCLFAYLTYKFQLVMLVPVALIGGHYWKAFKAFALALLVLFLLGCWQLGWQGWVDYVHLIARHAEVMREKHGKIIARIFISIFVSARLRGLSEPLAMAMQIAFGLLAAWGILRAAQTRNPAAMFIMLACGGLLATPYAYIYDITPMGVAAGLLVARGMCLPPDWKMRLLLVYLAAAPMLVMLFEGQWVPDAPIYLMVVWLLGMHWVNQLPRHALWPDSTRNCMLPEPASPLPRWTTGDRIFALMAIIGVAGAIWIGLTMMCGVLDAPSVLNDYRVFYDTAQRPLVSRSIYPPPPVWRFLQHLPVSYGPYLYAPFYLLPLRLLHQLPVFLAEALWLSAHTLIFACILLSRAFRRFAEELGPRVSADRMVQLSFLLSLSLMLFVQFCGHPTLSSAGLLLLGAVWLKPKPFCAGLVWAILTYKFQMVMMVPFALLAWQDRAGRKRAILGFVSGLAIAFLIGLAMLGWQGWLDFFRAVHGHALIVRHSYRTLGGNLLASPFIALRWWNIDETGAFALQAVTAIAAIWGTILAARRGNAAALFLMLATGFPLVSPYVYIYDLAPVAVAAAMLGARGVAAPAPSWLWRLGLIPLALLPFLIIHLNGRTVPPATFPLLAWLMSYLWLRRLPPLMRESHAPLTEN